MYSMSPVLTVPQVISPHANYTPFFQSPTVLHTSDKHVKKIPELPLFLIFHSKYWMNNDVRTCLKCQCLDRLQCDIV